MRNTKFLEVIPSKSNNLVHLPADEIISYIAFVKELLNKIKERIFIINIFNIIFSSDLKGKCRLLISYSAYSNYYENNFIPTVNN